MRSASYNAEREHTILATDPAIGIQWPSVPGGLRMSDRDRDAPSLAEVRTADLLPIWGRHGHSSRACDTASRTRTNSPGSLATRSRESALRVLHIKLGCAP